MKYLMLTLYAPMAAYGDTSMGRWRRSWTRPGKSAVFGMIGAALGIDRDNADALRGLNNGTGYAVRSDVLGDSLIDYHTYSAGKGAKAKKARTRRHELFGEVNTKVTRREYRTDSLHTIALWERDGAPVTLTAISEALQCPHWTLYVGRRSCPLALPLDPEIIEAGTLIDALAARSPMPPEIAEAMGLDVEPGRTIAADVDANVDDRRIEQRRDQYHHVRTYTVRLEHIAEVA